MTDEEFQQKVLSYFEESTNTMQRILQLCDEILASQDATIRRMRNINQLGDKTNIIVYGDISPESELGKTILDSSSTKIIIPEIKK